LDRFEPRLVALGAASPEPLLVAALDLLRERSELVALLALVRRGLLFECTCVSATLIDLERLDLPPEFLGVAGAVLASLGVLGVREGSRRSAAPVLRLFAGAEVWGAAASVFDALRPAAGFLCVDARAPFERSPLAST
jgi:hypothetical protein